MLLQALIKAAVCTLHEYRRRTGRMPGANDICDNGNIVAAGFGADVGTCGEGRSGAWNTGARQPSVYTGARVFGSMLEVLFCLVPVPVLRTSGIASILSRIAISACVCYCAYVCCKNMRNGMESGQGWHPCVRVPCEQAFAHLVRVRARLDRTSPGTVMACQGKCLACVWGVGV